MQIQFYYNEDFKFPILNFFQNKIQKKFIIHVNHSTPACSGHEFML